MIKPEFSVTKFIIRTILIFYVFVLCNCNVTKYVPDGETLYNGAKVEIDSPHKIKGEKKIISEAQSVIKLKPNSKILGQRVKLWIYHHAKEPKKEKGLKYWIKYKLGELPVYTSAATPSATSELITAKVFNKGFFKAITSHALEENEKKKEA